MKNEYLNIGFFGDHQSGKTSLIQTLMGNKIDDTSFIENSTDFSYHNLKIENETKNFTIFDTPGLRKYIKNTAVILNNVDCYILVLSILDDELDFSLSKSGIFNNLLLILFSKKIKKFYIVVNKLDDNTISFSNEIFNNIIKKINYKIQNIGFIQKEYEFIPISVYSNENISSRSENITWYNGKTLYDIFKEQKYINNFEKMPMRFNSIKSYKITGKGTVILGYIQSGVLKKGDKVMLLPNLKETYVKSIFYYKEELDTAKKGILVGLNLKGIYLNEINRGLILTHINKEIKNIKGETIINKIQYDNSKECYLKTKVIVLNHPNGIKIDSVYMMQIHSGRVPVIIKSIKLLKKNKENNLDEDFNDFILKGCLGSFELLLLKPIKVEKYNEWKELGTFFLYDMNIPYCFGMIENIEFKIENSEKEIVIESIERKESINQPIKNIKKMNSLELLEKEKIEDYIPIKQNEIS